MISLQVNNSQLEKATQSLIEYGIVGVLLFLAVVIIGALLWYGRKNYNKQILDKDREIIRQQHEIESMRINYRNEIESAINACQTAINRNDRTLDDNNKFLNEIRLLLIKILESKL